MRVAEVVAELMRFDEDAEVVLDVSFDNGYGREWNVPVTFQLFRGRVVIRCDDKWNIFESSGGPRKC